MALIPDAHTTQGDGGAKRGTVPAGSTGIFTFTVARGKLYNFVVANNTGGTYNIGYYLFSADDDVNDSMTRTWVDDAATLAITDAVKNVASVIGAEEIGINITVASSTDLTVELVECKL
jgi:hypothetical protein